MKRALGAIAAVALLAIGVAVGLVYTWVLAPVEYVDSSPDSLYLQDKLVYLTVVGDLYLCQGDLALAKDGLAALEVEADGPVLADLLEQYLAAGGRPEAARGLALLAQDLGASGGVLLVFGARPIIAPENSLQPSPAALASPAPVVSPTPFPTLTPAPSFRLAERTSICAGPAVPGHIRVWVEDERGEQLPGVQVVVNWAMGQDRLFTGLRPEEGLGYADFEMKPGGEYDVTLADFVGDTAEGLKPEMLISGICPTDTIALDWRLLFVRSP